MIRRTFGIAAVVLLLMFGIPAAASAHVLKVDGDIGAVLHINPDDNPTTGGSTDYIISFSDDTGRFSLLKCDCSVSIITDGRALATRPLGLSSSEISENHFTFTRPAVYDMHFTGIPKTPDAFQPFTLDYEVRVTDGQTSTQPMPLLLWVGMGMIVGLVLLGGYAMNYDTNETTRRNKS